MRTKTNRSRVITILLVLTLFLAAVLYVGCGEGASDAYREAVLEGWSELEASSEELAQAASSIQDQEDLESFSVELADARGEIASFEDELFGLKVPDKYAASHQALEDFLASYDECLAAMEDMLDSFLAGEEYTATPAPQLEAAQRDLEDYRGSQNYNPARLDQGVWDILHILDETMGTAVAGYGEALRTVDSWYGYLNAGNGESMYALLDAQSPILDTVSRQFFITQVAESYGGEMHATHRVVDAEISEDADGDWYTAFLVVDYSATVDMEGNPVPAHSENVQFRLVNRGDGWYVYDIQSSAGIW